MAQSLVVGPYPQETQRTFTSADGLPAAEVQAVEVSPQGQVLVGTAAGLFQGDGEKWKLISPRPPSQGPGQPSAPTLIRETEGVWRVGSEGLVYETAEETRLYTPENSGLLSADIRALVRDERGFFWVATAAGVNIFDGRETWYALTGANGLPVEDVTHLALAPDGTRWFGTPQGVIRWREGKWKYFAGRRWLPDDRVLALAAAPDGSAWVGTAQGLTHLYPEEMTLAEKAARFEARIAVRHKRHGYVTSCHLEEPGNPASFIHEASDNDGLWTSLYVAAQCFQYAATGDEAARERARESLHALRWLEEVTPLKGFPARAAVKKGERVIKSSGEWHESPDGEWEWKGDTSSDEVDGHMFAYGVYYDLIPDEADRTAIRETVHRIMSYILENDFLLIDVDGERTTWGVWSPTYLNGPWQAQQGLNSLEILAHLRTAYHITGDEKFLAAYHELAREHHYALNTIEQKIIPPGEVNHSDDELAFLAYYALLRYETDPDLRAIYLLSLERSWQIERPEHNPLWNFIYGALTGLPCDLEASVQTLREIPLDLISWDVRNSHRADITLDEEAGRFGEVQSVEVLPADERPIMKWNGNPYRLDGGNGGRSEDDGTYFLLPYWLGRYYGFIREAS